jgi:hypothetical protein
MFFRNFGSYTSHTAPHPKDATAWVRRSVKGPRLGRPKLCSRIILKWILEKKNRARTGLIWRRIATRVALL